MTHAIAAREHVGATAHVSHAHELLTTRIRLENPAIVVILRGCARVQWGGQEHVLESGRAIAIAAQHTFDAFKTPCNKTGVYEAQWLTCDGTVTAQYSEGPVKGTRIGDVHALKSGGTSFLKAFAHAREGILRQTDIPTEVARIRMTELLTWLDHDGAYFGHSQRPALATQVRRRIADELSTAWTAPLMAESLGLSEATLRRRLSAERTSFHELLIDVRMSKALTLLQVTDLSVTLISLEIGYSSPSRFTARFRQKFGYGPSDVRRAA
ncbi:MULTISPECIES: helix-turn-helix transcriptional regulator [Paraburkholderia]|uniref:AraC family transcriptional regulator n=1 Tax=Paraburkholderia metrosideri TaxID=580937 RepID=A0ABW9E2B9_9BURK